MKHKDGCVHGDDSAMPDRGTKTGRSTTYGFDTDIASTNNEAMTGADRSSTKRDDQLPIRQNLKGQ